MSKIRFHIPKELIANIISIEDKSLLHKIKNVLSLKVNETVYIFDGQGNEYIYKICEINRNSVKISMERTEIKKCENTAKIILAVPLLKEQKLDLIFQKAAELGVKAFLPFICERSIREKPSSAKIERWKKIAHEATRQSQRLWIPEIRSVISFEELVKQESSLKLAASIKGKIMQEVDAKADNILIAIGPEGDFSDNEYLKLEKYGFSFIKLSKNILRTETACIFSVGLVNYFIE